MLAVGVARLVICFEFIDTLPVGTVILFKGVVLAYILEIAYPRVAISLDVVGVARDVIF